MTDLLKPPVIKKTGAWSRRQLLKLGLASAGVAGGAIAWQNLTQKQLAARIPPMPPDAVTVSNIHPMQIVRDFDYGTVTREKGRTVREFRMEANTSTVQLNSLYTFTGSDRSS